MAINNEIISTSWEGQQKSFIEAGLKTLLQRMLEVLESPLAANSVGSNQLTQELRDVINSIGSKVPNTRTVNDKELSSNITIGPDDIMVGNQTLSTVLVDIGQGGGLASRIAALEQSLNNLTGAEDTTQIIDTFNEVIDFLNGIDTDDPTLFNQLLALSNDISALQTALAGKISGINTSDNTPLPPDSNGIVTLPPAGSTISPATAAPSMDGTANVGSSAKYAREDHVHPHDTSKQNKLTFDPTPTAGSTNPVTSGGVKIYVDGKATIIGTTSNQDGTFTIVQSDGNSFTVNLNHVHPQYLTEHQSLSGYAKFVLCQDEAEYNAIATKDSGTLYLIPES